MKKALPTVIAVVIVIILTVFGARFAATAAISTKEVLPTYAKVTSSLNGFDPYYFYGIYSDRFGKDYDSLIIKWQDEDGDSSFDVLIDYVFETFVENNVSYYYGKNGLAIIYPESDICKLYIFNEEDREDSKIHFARKDRSSYKHLVVLDSFDEFTPYERKILINVLSDIEKGYDF